MLFAGWTILDNENFQLTSVFISDFSILLHVRRLETTLADRFIFDSKLSHRQAQAHRSRRGGFPLIYQQQITFRYFLELRL
jgi:mRNA-degrading endonuclease RelE of RelBE toxin-antitoxin system